MSRRRSQLLLVLAGTVAALAALEVGLRIVTTGSPEFAYETYYESESRARMTFHDAVARGEIAVGNLPRGRGQWVKPQTFFICYKGAKGPEFDDRGCVRVDINQLGIRDRKELTYEKPPSQRRILCLGDSFTFGWGVSVERTWPRLLEARLSSRGDVRSINCGAAGTLLVDEYWWGLRDRFGKFGPDVVLVTLCLNDLAPFPDTVGLFRTSVLQGCPVHGWYLRWTCEACIAHVRSQNGSPTATRWSRLLDWLRRGDELRSRLQLDPAVDWGQVLLDMPVDWPAPLAAPDEKGSAQTFYQIQGMPPEASWQRGGPQQALREIRSWCAAHDVVLGVVVWPLFQGLESPQRYPFTTLHRVVTEFAQAEGIPLLDLLPSFLNTESELWWVDPSDMHANAAGHARATPAIAAFVDRIWPARD